MQIRPFALERYFAQHEFSAEFLLCSSDVEAYGLPELLALADDEMRALWDDLSLGYTETAGHPRLRAEIAALYPGLEADDVLVFAGAQERSSPSPRPRSAATTTRSSSRRPTSRCTRSPAPPARR
jgi:hypothetical protein